MRYYKPKSKHDLQLWVLKRYKYAEKDIRKMGISQLWAIYYRIIKQHEQGGLNGA